MNTSKPKNITDDILAFCREIELEHKPAYIPVRSGEGCESNSSMTNVTEYQRLHGGEIQYGWTIWEWPERLLEAKFHAVWVSSEGELIDITPSAAEGETVLFLPDSERVYEGRPVDNIRKALADSPEVRLMTESAKMFFDMDGKYSIDDEVDMNAVSSDLLKAHSKAIGKSTVKAGRNEPCPCGSGLKYKKCCGGNTD